MTVETAHAQDPASPAESASSTPEGSPWRRGFWSLIATQFQGAFSDNALRSLVTYLIIGMGLSTATRDALVPLVGALFSIPFILFSMLGGQLADRYSKRSISIGVKVFEIGVMLLATAGLTAGSLPIGMTAVFLMGVHSSIFGPSKYGLLPELLPESRLSWGNGIIELTTFLAIILGLASGALLSEYLRGRHAISGALLIALACVGLACSLGITRVRPADPGRHLKLNPIRDLRVQIGRIRADRQLVLAVLGNTYFFFLAALLQLNIVLYGKDVLHLSDTANSALAAAIAIGIGTGSYAAGSLSGGKIEVGLVPIGAIGMTVLGALLSIPGLSFWAVAVGLAIMGFFGGFFIVPIAALIQHRPAPEHKGGVIAAANLISFIGIAGASGAYYLMEKAGTAASWEPARLVALVGCPGAAPLLASVHDLRPGAIFLAVALLTAGGTVYLVHLLPESLLRLVLWLATHTVYRIRVVGRQHIPERGGALFVCNHVSFVDALLLIASTDRFVRFLMYQDYYERPVIRPLARVLRVIPVSSQQRPRDLVRALRTASEAIAAGEIVCIFAEGQITRIGQLLPFRRGFERIMEGVDAPIIPVSLDGVWGSVFSYAKGRFVWKIPRRIPYPVTVSFGAPMPPTSTPAAVRSAVQDLATRGWQLRSREMPTLSRAFLRTARRHPRRFAMADARVPRLSFGSSLTRTVFLVRRLRETWRDQSMVGILLPPSVPGALVNLAALAMGKIPVNLNYTLASETLDACVRQCAITTIVSSPAFLERLPPRTTPLPARLVTIEDLAARPGAGERIAAALIAWLLPVRLLERVLASGRPPRLDDLATIVFSSGSTGEPKGVMLTHANIAANVEQLGQTFALGPDDRMLGVLPFFHSFGFTGTLALPAALGLGVVYAANPLDARGIGELARRYEATVLLATPTFLQIYLRGIQPEELGSLTFLLTGAEKLPERLARAFEDRFGIRPMEGYGCTECSPAVAVNVPDFRGAGIRQVGSKRGRIGHPLPGVSVRIVDPDSGGILPYDRAGLMLVRGPNIMKGYLGRPDLTAEVLQDGWYATGDIASQDEDGFLEITDRLSRFSKIGGEMVPHIRVEEALHDLAGVTHQTFAVAGVPDEKKGERLVVLHTLGDDALRTVLDALTGAGLPNLWIPRRDAFYRVESLPVLGTGKLDLRRVRETALAMSGAGAS